MFVVGGESLIDLVQDGIGPDGKIRMSALQGGSPYNCAIALAKLGNRTGFLCPISKDTFGEYLLGPLASAGVEPLLKERVAEPTTLAVVTFDERKQASYAFYRSADHAYTAAGLAAALPAELDVLQIGGFTTIQPADAAIWLDVAKTALKRGTVLTMDPNVRASLVSDFAAYVRQLDTFFELAHLVKISIEDLYQLDKGRGLTEAEKAQIEATGGFPADVEAALEEKYSKALLARPNCELVVVTLGERGSWARTRSSITVSAKVHSPPVFVDTVGAGDSLMAGILSFLGETGDLAPGKLGALDAAKLAGMLRFGAVVAGLNCGQKGCNPPTRAEVDAVLAAR